MLTLLCTIDDCPSPKESQKYMANKGADGVCGEVVYHLLADGRGKLLDACPCLTGACGATSRASVRVNVRCVTFISCVHEVQRKSLDSIDGDPMSACNLRLLLTPLVTPKGLRAEHALLFRKKLIKWNWQPPLGTELSPKTVVADSTRGLRN